MSPRVRCRGISLIEVVIFIVVVAIGFTALFLLQSNVMRGTVDPLVRKQALALASSLMEEIQLRGFTYCDPGDPNVYTAASTADCTTAEALGLEAGESHATRSTLDNVSDYATFPGMSDAGIVDISGVPISATELAGYAVAISVANIGAGELAQVTDTTDGLRITVTVSGPTGISVSLQGYRLRYAPNSP
jgi:MSHA pilin protein MshD